MKQQVFLPKKTKNNRAILIAKKYREGWSMAGRKAGLLSVMTVMMLLLGGCGSDGSMDAEAKRWYEEMRGNGSVTNDVLPDGADNYTGGPNDGTDNTERNTYGMQTEEGDTTLGEDIRRAWDDVKDDGKHMEDKENEKDGR